MLALKSPQVDGRGHIQLVERNLEITIPPGVKAGQGSPDQAGTAAGDLFLEVIFRPHRSLQINGVDLVMTLPRPPWEAAPGAVVPVVLPDGRTLKVCLPLGTKGGQKIKVRGKG